MGERITAILLSAVLAVLLFTGSAFAAENPFQDVSEADWFYEPVLYVYENGLFSGTSNEQFSPSESMTRAMLVTVLYRQTQKLGIGTTSPESKFSDLTKDWYRSAINWAAANGIVNGVTATEFQPDVEVSREQLCAIVIRYLRDYLHYDLSAYAGSSSFIDSTNISSFAAESVALAQNMKLISGKASGDGFAFDPKAGASRAAVAKIVTLESKLLGSLQKDADSSGTASGGQSSSGGHTAAELAKESEIAGYLQVMIQNYQQSDYAQTVDEPVKNCMTLFIQTLSDALAARDSGAFLSQKYVSAHYAVQIASVKAQYQSLTEEQIAQLKNVVIRLGTTAQIYAVMDYFNVSIASLS